MPNKERTARQQKKNLIKIDYKSIFEKAYQLMDEPILLGNCGELCNYHCCRHCDHSGERLGMYLLPLEFEYIQSDTACDYALHSHHLYDMPPKIKKLYYVYCQEADGCLRDLRPIQCRTYPFEPHFENDTLTLVIEKEQIHKCPLLDRISSWRPEFIEGIYNGWMELLKIPIIRYCVAYDSQERIANGNISKHYHPDGWVHHT